MRHVISTPGEGFVAYSQHAAPHTYDAAPPPMTASLAALRALTRSELVGGCFGARARAAAVAAGRRRRRRRPIVRAGSETVVGIAFTC